MKCRNLENTHFDKNPLVKKHNFTFHDNLPQGSEQQAWLSPF